MDKKNRPLFYRGARALYNRRPRASHGGSPPFAKACRGGLPRLYNRQAFRYNERVREIADDRSFALVLGGGGTKGAYQIGAWRAFRELGLRFHAIVGASVGALNGALMAQGAYEAAIELWRTISIDRIVTVPRGLSHNPFASFAELNRVILRNHGLDTQPLRDLIRRSVDERLIRASGVDFGITTYELTDLKALSIFLEEIPHGLLADYLLASASFPAFRMAEIQGKRFADGGIFDNIPFRMARSRGYRRIIVVDISGLGVNRKPDVVGTETVYIKNSIEMGSIFELDQEFIRRFMELGYLDTMRIFARYEGIRYFIAPDPALFAELDRLIREPSAAPSLASLLRSAGAVSGDSLLHRLREHLPRDMREYRDISLPLLECAALTLDIERVRPYTLSELLAEIRAARDRVLSDGLPLEEQDLRSLLRPVRRALRTGDQSRSGLPRPPLAYDLAIERFASARKRAVARSALRALFPYLVAGRALLAILDRYLDSLPTAASGS